VLWLRWVVLCGLLLLPVEGFALPAAPGVPLLETQVGRLIAHPQFDGPQPLLLVHGIGAENEKPWFHWGAFLRYLTAHPEHAQRFRVYLYQFDSSKSVPEISADLNQTLLKWQATHPQESLKILAYSEGGLLVRNVLQDPRVNVKKVITVGTPFHGSPLANPAWLHQQTRQTSVLSPVRMFMGLSYKIARKRYPSFEADFQWDNFDQALLTTDKGEVNGYLMAHDPRFVTYGSFFSVDADDAQELAHSLNTTLPRERYNLKDWFSQHFLFFLVNNNIAKMPLANPSKTTPLMAYNDGISPISSTLWMGRFVKDKTTVSLKHLWQALLGLRGTGVARLFPALDHRDWLDGDTRCKTLLVQDLLNPDQPPKPVFEWFLADLTTTAQPG
jgi:pimeloyl-ACP methyl ester carboxylesterase